MNDTNIFNYVIPGEDTMKLLTECAAEFGQTLIVVTHNPEIAKKAQQIIRIEDGCIIKGL